jgi:hypothetical protein
MTEISLGDYAGYVFTELVRAREISDRYSRALADRYAEDEVMRHFSVPRFKIPKMQLTMPVLVSQAKVSQVVQFNMPEEEFVEFVAGRVEFVRQQLDGGGGSLALGDARHAEVGRRIDIVPSLARELYAELTSAADPALSDGLVASRWPELLDRAMRADGVVSLVARDPDGALVNFTMTEVATLVRQRTYIDAARIDGVMVEPVTHAVRDGSSDSTVFVVTAEMVEDGFYLRSIRDEESGETKPIVEFD